MVMGKLDLKVSKDYIVEREKKVEGEERTNAINQ